jgi:rRNA maturation protein Rpf1
LYTLFRDSTDLSGGNGLVFINKNHGSPICMTFLDSPNTTSSTTYAVYVKGESGFTTRINQGSTKGSIVAMEISA